MTIRELFNRYIDSQRTGWRPTTLRNKTARWKQVEKVLSPDTLAHRVTRELADAVKNSIVEDVSCQGRSAA